jgi:hypothetical protein
MYVSENSSIRQKLAWGSKQYPKAVHGGHYNDMHACCSFGCGPTTTAQAVLPPATKFSWITL